MKSWEHFKMGALQDDNEWLLAHVDQLDAVNNEAEWEWDSAPNEWQMMEENDPLDYVTLPYLFAEYEYELARN
ncbi:hypothetical protein RHGRI_020758 [Rhododendron griersonianum]|uniref:Uncharacterized protein n=1 Tax=Rhododendron griersonianum TaxID=479676 RepID=A0AAV6JJG6_9ERIC|nr:hypothetical protein RHGRI_020758 [Rhododendron griersonianum]